MTEAIIDSIIKQAIGSSSNLESYRSVGGGCINRCYQVMSGASSYFLKLNSQQYLDMFQAEHQGLEALAEKSDLLIPKPIAHGQLEQVSYLLMEYVVSTARSDDYWEQLGQGLAALHSETATQFGWNRDNYIGRLPQSNKLHGHWIDFFVRERLMPQMKMATASNLLPPKVGESLEHLCQRLEQFLPIEKPALLHGDLWSGNVMTGPQGEPCLVDPAIYFGHRETEIAFTTLFGGFDSEFYQAYQHSNPLNPGYPERFEIYNLYPLLVHLNLFGTSYLGDITRTLNKFL